jgi:23S rRNA (adenine2503-C2)-methyltransferase
MQWRQFQNAAAMLTQPYRRNIIELKPGELIAWLQGQGIASYRAGQILKWVYPRQADTFDVMTDLGKAMRTLLSRHFSINRLRKRRVEISKDGSRKYLFELEDGKCVESVLIPERDHYTLCISSQVGCAQGCRFCLTARSGFVRNLTAGEIISQVRDPLCDVLNDPDDSRPLSNIVFMGMGEPLANYVNVRDAIQILTECDFGYRFSNRRVTVSTAGLIPQLSVLGRETKVNLAISLNATDNKTRSMLMPINRKYPIEKLLEACKAYPLRRGRRITFEYILIRGVNDSPEDAGRLVRLLRPIRAKINLIPFNEHDGSDLKRPAEQVIHRFQEILHESNYTAIIRHSKGQDISAACGQLSARMKSKAEGV